MDERTNPMDEVRAWLREPEPGAFPYEAVVTEFNRVGKHFVARELLATLDGARQTLRARSGPDTALLARFLDIALDKWDGRYDNPSYLAVTLLPLPGTGPRGHDVRHAAGQRDRLLALLIADTLRFELAAAEGRTSLLPEMRPDARTTAKRCRLGVRAIRPVLERLRLHVDVIETQPLAAAREVCGTVFGALSAAERRLLRLTALPVSVVHDEYMFIRVLQSYETTFAVMAAHLRTAVDALTGGRATVAVDGLAAAERALREAAPLWSLVATMQPQAFLTFREFTEGASAIQSRGYKTVESLCRVPERSRVDSPAYRSVPEVRERVLAGHPNLDDALASALGSGRLTPEAHAGVRSAMEQFETALLAWRQTHYRLAVRMLGQRRGTGYTEGVPYLAEARSIRVFAAGGAGCVAEAA